MLLTILFLYAIGALVTTPNVGYLRRVTDPPNSKLPPQLRPSIAPCPDIPSVKNVTAICLFVVFLQHIIRGYLGADPVNAAGIDLCQFRTHNGVG